MFHVTFEIGEKRKLQENQGKPFIPGAQLLENVRFF